MRRLSDHEAEQYGVRSVHHEMENGELRFRLVNENGSSYILTQSTSHTGWQKAHVHYLKREFYVVEKGIVLIVLLEENKLKLHRLCENDSLSIPSGIAHNVLMSDHAILHTVKYGSQESDWNACPELDEMLAGMDPDRLLKLDDL